MTDLLSFASHGYIALLGYAPHPRAGGAECEVRVRDILRRMRRTIGEEGPNGVAEPATSPVEVPTAFSDAVSDPGEGPPDQERWTGYIDHVDRSVITGWAYDRDKPDGTVAVEVVASNGKRAMTFAAIFRRDVKDAGYGSGTYGFEIDVAGMVSKDETLMVRFADSKVAISKAPFSLDPQRSLLDGRLPAAFANAMRLRALDVKAKYADLEKEGAIGASRGSGA